MNECNEINFFLLLLLLLFNINIQMKRISVMRMHEHMYGILFENSYEDA